MPRSSIWLAAVLLASCGPSPQKTAQRAQALNTFDVEESSAAAPAVAKGPHIAYSYTITYAFDRRSVEQVQGRQLAFCRRLGPAHCLVVKSTLNAPGPDDHIVTDQAVLLVDARQAGALTRRLDALAIAGGAIPASREVEAEDVTKQVIDTEARVKAKQVLATRLLAIIESGNGKVGELVEAERAYAATQEELDAARSERADLAQRIAMSRFTINYAFNDTPGRGSPIRTSVAAASDTLASSIAALLTAIVAALPWMIVGGAVIAFARWIRRKRGWRWPRRAPAAPAPQP